MSLEKEEIHYHDCLIDRIPFGHEDLFVHSILAVVPENIEIRTNCPERKLKTDINIDPCLFFEIKTLWNRGIVTTGCCCGHNIGFAYIGVEEEFIPKMKELGYEVQYNPMRPNDEDSFKPKSLK